MTFGNYAIVSEAKHYFEKEPDWYWEFKPPTAKEDLAISKYIKGGSVTTSHEGVTRNDVRTTEEIAIEELSLTFASTNIPNDEGTPVLKAGANPAQVKKCVEGMPPEMYKELWSALGEHVPGWGPVPVGDEEDPN